MARVHLCDCLVAKSEACRAKPEDDSKVYSEYFWIVWCFYMIVKPRVNAERFLSIHEAESTLTHEP